MPRAWKGKVWLMTAVSQTDAKIPASTAKHTIGRTDSQSQSQSLTVQAITLVATTPVKKPLPRAKSNTLGRASSSIHIARSSSSYHWEIFEPSPPAARVLRHSILVATSFLLRLSLYSTPVGKYKRDEDKDADEEIWLPNSSPNVLLLGKSGWITGAKKRVPSNVSDMMASDTPVRKRIRLGR
ncbi:hypothetical protein DFH29DRAFT_1005796 [Suillus ampliporus]|nr:hypothetical protein DFH29DRAFT_1005796 [Suillus ampliporus]